MTEQDFQALAAQGYTAIPILREVLADLDTPLSTYLKLANGPYSYLFESVQGGEKWARYSIIGLPCAQVIRVYGKRICLYQDNVLKQEEVVEDPLAWIEHYQQTFKVAPAPGLPKFTGGLVGYFGYDTIRYIESRLATTDKTDPLQLPDILLMVSQEVIVFDNLSGKLYLIVHANPAEHAAYAKAQALLDAMRDNEKPFQMYKFVMPKYRGKKIDKDW